MKFIEVRSSRGEELIDITEETRRLVEVEKWANGAAHLFCQHTTCGLTINEGADPDVRADLIKFFRQIAPRDGGWLHREGNSDAHIRATLTGASLLVPIVEGRLALGVWQHIYLYEGDGPRVRRVLVQRLQ